MALVYSYHEAGEEVEVFWRGKRFTYEIELGGWYMQLLNRIQYVYIEENNEYDAAGD